MKSGRWWKRGRVLAAENLLLSTSVISLRPWQNNKFKGNQPSWRISLPYFQWGTLEEEKGESRVYPKQDLINSHCVHTICQVSLVPTLPNTWTKTLSSCSFSLWQDAKKYSIKKKSNHSWLWATTAGLWNLKNQIKLYSQSPLHTTLMESALLA